MTTIIERPPLEGLRVLDLTTFLSGPSATQLLGDLGAEIIKVESLDGDSSRAIVGPTVLGETAYFLANNRNKRSVAINLKSPRGLEVLKRLISRVDVVIENFRPGVTARLGIDPKTITAEQPALIWASISGFGQDGPLRDRPAYDMIVQALSGVMSLNGHPGSPAARLGIPAGDVVAGLYAVIGLLAALDARHKTGRGRIIDVSMLRGQLSMLSYQALYTSLKGVAPGPQGAGHDSIATYRSFRGGDGREFVVTANTPRMWEGLCRVLGVGELVGDERFLDAASRLRNKEALWEILEARFAERPAAEWIDLLAEASVPVASVKNVLEALTDARAAKDGSMVLVESDEASFENVATPIRFVDTEDVPPTYPPALGGDTFDILVGELGIPEAELESLIADRVVIATPQKERVA
ncbi:crotonobetainyl-CoA:carnitine CoA-transferase CaiB-like acyl-CoA transferase [Actinocorallia herbida]|uniref:Crotonobetainyl-CoA:carnitine CoA-transferase CaiB-like acyl-CoA transferase n=1 Tax=Actinocorallia herbida TaxID=58109 RepID=A0A3N1D2X3_9ACTN|nr:CoA transferase [Actinocorallia herbida]ROO87418.1 crotonobetainyl-CoA:carnitine CoA-transferase CaiB-like acyl-CoA transferase [Actinocorallia herbida]